MRTSAIVAVWIVQYLDELFPVYGRLLFDYSILERLVF